MKEKTKILLCVTKSNWGGAQKYVYNLAISMPDKQFDISVVCGGNGELIEKLKRLGIKTIEIKNLSRDIGFKKDIHSFFEIKRIFETENPEIVHLNSSKMGIMGSLAVKYINLKNKILGIITRRKYRPIKIVFTAHGWAFNEERSTFQKILLKFIQGKTVSFSDVTIAVSEAVRNQIPKESDKEKTVTIYNGIETSSFLTKKKSRDILFLKTGGKIEITTKTKIFGTISELHKNKGLSYAIKAFKMLKDTSVGKDSKMVIIGEGEERKSLENLIKEVRMEKEIFLIGHVSPASQLLKSFDFFFLTSITEALPYALLEAGSAGLPIMATNVGGIPEIIDDEINGLLSRSKNYREIFIMFNYVLSNKEKTTVFGKRIKEKVLKKFNIKQCIKKTLKVYSQILEEKV